MVNHDYVSYLIPLRLNSLSISSLAEHMSPLLVYDSRT
jgi:hypothetical protein